MRLFSYIDPAAGGLLIQVLLGGTAGVLALFRGKIRRLFKSGSEATVLPADRES